MTNNVISLPMKKFDLQIAEWDEESPGCAKIGEFSRWNALDEPCFTFKVLLYNCLN